MKRLTYIYSIIPLCAALGFIRRFEAWTGSIGAMVIGGLLALALWALVWLRLYSDGRLRPEFAVLSVLPVFCYLGLKMADEETMAMFSEPSWQNMYFVVWCASAVILIWSARLSPAEKAAQAKTDSRSAVALTFIVSAFIILYVALTWMGTASDLYMSYL